MVDLNKISKANEGNVWNLYSGYRKSELKGKANKKLLEEMDEIFIKLFPKKYERRLYNTIR